MILRLLIVAVLVLAGGALTLAYRRSRSVDEARGAIDPATGLRPWPDLPRVLRRREPEGEAAAGIDVAGPAGAERTWVIFTTPFCASCTAVRADIVAHEPASLVLTVDATVHPDLAEAYGVRRAPTTVLADHENRIVERLVGPEAVRAHLRLPDPPDPATTTGAAQSA